MRDWPSLTAHVEGGGTRQTGQVGVEWAQLGEGIDSREWQTGAAHATSSQVQVMEWWPREHLYTTATSIRSRGCGSTLIARYCCARDSVARDWNVGDSL